MTPVKVTRGRRGRPRGKYKPSTPVLRLQGNVDKVLKQLDLMEVRLTTWQVSGDDDVSLALGEVQDVRKVVRDELRSYVEALHTKGFVPPKQDGTSYEPGQRFKVLPKYRPKYEQIYQDVLKTDPGFLDDLVLVQKLVTGELLVRRGSRRPFAVRKSHVQALKS